MLRKNRLLIVALAGSALLFWVFSYGWLQGASYNPHSDRYEQYRYAADKPEEIESSLSIQSNSKAFEYRKPCRDSKGLSESELCAQWRAANAAEDSVIWSMLGFFASSFALVGLFWSLYYTRKAVEDARNATETMQDSNKIAESNHREALQPYIAISQGKLKIDDNIQPIALLQLKNFGQSPAIDVQTWFSIWVECYPLHSDLPRAPVDMIKGKQIIGPGATSDIYHPRGCPLNIAEQREVVAGRAAIYVFGEATYSDIWGNKFCSEFILFACGAEQVGRRRLSAYMEGNIIRNLHV